MEPALIVTVSSVPASSLLSATLSDFLSFSRSSFSFLAAFFSAAFFSVFFCSAFFSIRAFCSALDFFNTAKNDSVPPSFTCIPKPLTCAPELCRLVFNCCICAAAPLRIPSYCLRNFSSVAICSILSSSMRTTVL